MFIHWFPGHMTKALREMAAEAKNVDCIVYVLDARIPASSVNPKYEEIFSGKPRLYVLNKADLVPSEELGAWKRHYASGGNRCITANSTVKGGLNVFLSEIRTLVAPLLEKYRQKGVKKTIRAMVVGVPNSGKSTLINSLIAKKRAATANMPGKTRGKQWISIDEYVDLLDTPGTLFPDFSDQEKATHLAMVGSIKDTVVDEGELAVSIVRFLENEHADALHAKYTMDLSGVEDVELLESIARKRGFFLKGGVCDIDRTAKAIIQDFRKQAFGKIILEPYENHRII